MSQKADFCKTSVRKSYRFGGLSAATAKIYIWATPPSIGGSKEPLTVGNELAGVEFAISGMAATGWPETE